MLTNGVALFHSSQIRECERIAVKKLGVTEMELMARAGMAAFKVMRHQFPTVQKIAVFCGSGNNAGDGYVLARLAHEAGYSVIINQYKQPDQLPPAAREAALDAISAGVPCQAMDDSVDQDTQLIVDALLGTGLQGDVREPMIGAIHLINSSELPVLAMDVPSGLDADTGKVMGACVRASATVTFIGYKLGLMTLDGPDQSGHISCHDLDLSACLATLIPIAHVLKYDSTAASLPKRPRNCHKRDFGHVLVIGGDYGMPGAVGLVAEAALRVGAGMVTIGTRPEHAHQALARLPEAMVYGLKTVNDLMPLIANATHCVIGPGLGTSDWAKELFIQVIASQLPMIIDASALRLLAQFPQQDDNWVLTPHPGEAASLLGCSTQSIQADRYHSVSQLQVTFGGNIVLKGVGSLVRTAEPATYLCDAGNPGMATAGMGDVLSGVIAGLAAQGLSLEEAAKLGVWIHAHAADLAVRHEGERGLIATDLMSYLRHLVNE
jgi:NAD(P)H-hydrate epimerase